MTELYLLLPLLFPLVLCILEHLFLPQVKKVRGIGVEFKCFLVVIPTKIDNKKVGQVYKCTGTCMNLYEVKSMHCPCFGRMLGSTFWLCVSLWED